MRAVGNDLEVHVPTPAQEAARDLSRAREDAREDLMRARHLLSKFLLRKGVVYEAGRRAWTKAHREWLSRIRLPDPLEQLVLEWIGYTFLDSFMRFTSNREEREPYARPEASKALHRRVQAAGGGTLRVREAETGDRERV
jgi:hypothetical protein